MGAIRARLWTFESCLIRWYNVSALSLSYEQSEDYQQSGYRKYSATCHSFSTNGVDMMAERVKGVLNVKPATHGVE